MESEKVTIMYLLISIDGINATAARVGDRTKLWKIDTYENREVAFIDRLPDGRYKVVFNSIHMRSIFIEPSIVAYTI